VFGKQNTAVACSVAVELSQKFRAAVQLIALVCSGIKSCRRNQQSIRFRDWHSVTDVKQPSRGDMSARNKYAKHFLQTNCAGYWFTFAACGK